MLGPTPEGERAAPKRAPQFHAAPSQPPAAGSGSIFLLRIHCPPPSAATLPRCTGRLAGCERPEASPLKYAAVSRHARSVSKHGRSTCSWVA